VRVGNKTKSSAVTGGGRVGWYKGGNGGIQGARVNGKHLFGVGRGDSGSPFGTIPMEQVPNNRRKEMVAAGKRSEKYGDWGWEC